MSYLLAELSLVLVSLLAICVYLLNEKAGLKKSVLKKLQHLKHEGLDF